MYDKTNVFYIISGIQTSTGICLKQEIPYNVSLGLVRLGKWKYTVSSSKLWEPSGSASVGKYFQPSGQVLASGGEPSIKGGKEYSTWKMYKKLMQCFR